MSFYSTLVGGPTSRSARQHAMFACKNPTFARAYSGWPDQLKSSNCPPSLSRLANKIDGILCVCFCSEEKSYRKGRSWSWQNRICHLIVSAAATILPFLLSFCSAFFLARYKKRMCCSAGGASGSRSPKTQRPTVQSAVRWREGPLFMFNWREIADRQSGARVHKETSGFPYSSAHACSKKTDRLARN